MSSLDTAYSTTANIGQSFAMSKFAFLVLIVIIVSSFGSYLVTQKDVVDANNKPTNNKLYGIGIIAVAFCILLIGGIGTYLTMTYKPLAAMSGASDVSSIVGGFFR
jgi:hypothetical protein